MLKLVPLSRFSYLYCVYVVFFSVMFIICLRILVCTRIEMKCAIVPIAVSAVCYLELETVLLLHYRE